MSKETLSPASLARPMILDILAASLAASSRLSLEMSFIPDEAIMAFASFTLVPSLVRIQRGILCGAAEVDEDMSVSGDLHNL